MPDINSLSATIASLSALSVVTERFVEIVKGTIPFLNQSFEGAKEQWRNTALRLLAVVGGLLTVSLSHSEMGGFIEAMWNKGIAGQIALGLLASGGSGFWNAVLKYAGAVKDLRKTDLTARSESMAAARVVSKPLQ
ncbi:MAG TPA: hypothetical protein PLK30_13790 [Blastocatellia bacterium]|nr:hypothetical protein [Blastocatellia bacterium]